MRRAVVLAIAIGAASCGDAAAPGDAATGNANDGFLLIDVPMVDGTTEPMWIYAASPAAAGPHPVVIYGHGQGASNLVVGCEPAGSPPAHADVAPSMGVADALAGAGYVGVAVFYPFYGTPPVPGTLTFRDHHVLDARAMLAAARWARDQHGKGSSRVAFTGNSMGSFPATWAVSSEPALHDLQDGLEIRAGVASGMLGNHIANASPQFRQIDDATLDLATRAATMALYIPAVVELRAAEAGLRSIDAGSVDAVTGDLTPIGRTLFTQVFIDPPPAVPECAGIGGRPAYCSSSCAGRIIDDLITTGAGGQIRAGDWYTASTVDAFAYWAPPDAIDPGASTGNTLLGRLRTISPAYTLPALVTPNVLPLVSTNDHTLPAQTAGSVEPGNLYIDHLRSVGAAIADPPPIVTGTGCDHGDYYLPSRPECGWSLVSAHLAAAFAP